MKITRKAVKILQKEIDAKHLERLAEQSPGGDSKKIPAIQRQIDELGKRLDRLKKRLPAPVPSPELSQNRFANRTFRV